MDEKKKHCNSIKLDQIEREGIFLPIAHCHYERKRKRNLLIHHDLFSKGISCWHIIFHFVTENRQEYLKTTPCEWVRIKKVRNIKQKNLDERSQEGW